MSTPLKFFSNVLDRVTLMADAIEMYSYRSGDFGLIVDGKNIYMEDGDEVLDVVDVKYKLISKQELVKRLVAVEAMEAKRGINAFVENSSSKEATHFFLNQQMNKLDYLLRAYNSSYKDKKEFTPLKMAMQDIWQNLLDKYDHLIDRQYKTNKKSHRTNSSTKVIWTGAPLIVNDWQELGTWIRDNFLDENGNELSEETIMTYIDPGRKDKKSKRYNIKVVKQ
jgi:hypothetical protein